MGFPERFHDMIRPVSPREAFQMSGMQTDPVHGDGGEKGLTNVPVTSQAEAGVSTIEAAQSIWGKTGFRLVCLG